MKRRDFLRISGTGTLASAALTSMGGLIYHQEQTDNKITYTGSFKEGDIEFYSSISIDHYGITNAKEADTMQKEVLIYFRKGTNSSTVTQFTSTIKKAKKTGNDNSKYKVQLQGMTFKQGEKTHLPTSLPKKMYLNVIIGQSISLSNKKGDVLATYSKYTPSTGDGYGGCFVTSACVGALQLPDNCVELETLRQLRENHMRNNADGEKLLTGYNTIGPNVVDLINKHPNAYAIWQKVYEDLILPSYKLMAEDKTNDTIAFYTEYVVGLEEMLLKANKE